MFFKLPAIVSDCSRTFSSTKALLRNRWLFVNCSLKFLFLICAAKLFGKASDCGADSGGNPVVHESPLATGMGNVSHSVPTLCPLYALEVAPVGRYLTEDFGNAVCTDDAFDRTMDAAKCMALTAIELFRNPGLVKRVRGAVPTTLPHTFSQERTIFLVL